MWRSMVVGGMVVPLVCMGSHLLYCKATESQAVITVTNKYQHTRPQGHADYYVIDERGTHFCLSPSLWYGKYATNEIYIAIEVGMKYSIKYFGTKSTLLGLYPSIVTIQKIKEQETTFIKKTDMEQREQEQQKRDDTQQLKNKREEVNEREKVAVMALNNRITLVEGSLKDLNDRVERLML